MIRWSTREPNGRAPVRPKIFLAGLLLPAAWLGCDLLNSVIGISDIIVIAKGANCPEEGRSVQFTALTSRQDALFRWFFTDGMPQDGKTVLHTFDANNRTYDVTLVATYADGRTSTLRTRVNVPIRCDDETGNGGVNQFGDKVIPNEGAIHIPVGQVANYRHNPPASGPHWSAAGIAPVEPGEYLDVVRPEAWVHNLEHGYVVYLYDCDGDCPESLLNQFRNLLAALPPSMFGSTKAVVTRYPGLPHPIVAVAWNIQRDFDAFDANGLRAFYERHVDRGPEDMP
jgi:hypothetical protein